jgi:hypothetical protein
MTWVWIAVFIGICTALMLVWVWAVERETGDE